jgi:hypothetical protein
MIVLTSGTMEVTAVNRKVTAKLFKNLKIGSQIEFSVALKKAGSNRGQTYSTYIKVKDVWSGETTLKSFNQLPTLLNAFEFEKVD